MRAAASRLSALIPDDEWLSSFPKCLRGELPKPLGQPRLAHLACADLGGFTVSVNKWTVTIREKRTCYNCRGTGKCAIAEKAIICGVCQGNRWT